VRVLVVSIVLYSLRTINNITWSTEVKAVHYTYTIFIELTFISRLSG